MIYELNDFDEAMRADYQFDLWRMAVSIVLVARQNNDLAMHQLEKVVDVFSQTYLDTLRSYRDLDDASRLDYDRRYGDNHGLRHAVAYRALTRCKDPHLGWMHLEPITVKCCDEDLDGSGYYSVRERSPFKEAFPGEVLDTRASFSIMAEQWAAVIATDHARAHQKLPDRVHDKTKKQDEAFLALVREIAFSDADQVKADWTCFRKAAGLRPGECDKPAFVPPSYRDMLPG